mmetsp:Transcript_7908/g.21805  ORF Transcript_7908/g.21805 Transcript_7908/m.21805 type:complete len:286 (+) Transcript_7908:583-1440(+)
MIRARHGILLPIPIQYKDFVSPCVNLLVGIDPMQDKCRTGLEPTDVRRVAISGNDRKPRTEVRVEPVSMHALLQQSLIPKEWEIVQDAVVGRETHVVRQPRSRKWNGHVMYQPIVHIHDSVMHVGRLLGVVEEQQFASILVHLCVRRDTVVFRWKLPVPRLGSQVLQGDRVQPVAVAALIESSERLSRVNHHIRAAAVLQRPLSTPPGTLGLGRVFCESCPQGLASFLLSLKTFGLHKPVSIRHAAISVETGLVNHSITVENVIPTDGFVHWVLCVSEVHTLRYI